MNFVGTFIPSLYSITLSYLLNKDGTVWYEFTFYPPQGVSLETYDNENFKAFSFDIEYLGMALRCVGVEQDQFAVIVNEETNLRKYVKRTDPLMKFETWEDYVLSRFAVGFDEKKIVILESPEGKAKNITYKKDNVFFHPVEIKGEWLKIKWDIKGSSNTDFGWIRWRNKEKLLIELFDMA